MVSRTLVRYFGMRFLGAVTSVFLGIFVLIVLVDYIELMRRDMADQNREQNKQNAEVLVQIASIKADLAVTTGDVRRLESRTDKLEVAR